MRRVSVPWGGMYSSRRDRRGTLAAAGCARRVADVSPCGVMTRRDRQVLFGLAALTFVVAVLAHAGVGGDVLLALPALLFALPLLAGRYVGEERLARLAAAFVPARSTRVAPLAPNARRSPRALPRGGRLIASSLAVRPPPVALSRTAA